MEFILHDQEKVIIKSGNTVSTTQTGKNQKRREVFCTRSILDFWIKFRNFGPIFTIKLLAKRYVEED